MAYPILLYHNAMEAATVTVTSTASGYHAANMLARVPWSRWKAGGTGTIEITLDHGASVTTTLDTLAITGHNLHECGGSLSVGRSADNVTYVSGSIMSPGDMTDSAGRTLILDTSSITGSVATRYHRITIASTTSAVWLGAVCWGKALTFPEYMHAGFDPQSIELKLHAPRTRSGSFLPASVMSLQQTVALKFSGGGLAESFFTATGTPSWSEFMTRAWAVGRPWWFNWDPTRWPQTGGWHCWPKKDDDSTVELVKPSRRQWTFDMVVSVEGYGHE